MRRADVDAARTATAGVDDACVDQVRTAAARTEAPGSIDVGSVCVPVDAARIENAGIENIENAPIEDRGTDDGRGDATFEPTPAAARARLAAIRPEHYADSRNHLRGAVTRLSPYLTHGFLTVPGVIASVRARHPEVGPRHKLVFELAWREYFREVWRREGDAIFSSRHDGPLPDAVYAREVPVDVREARTGLAVIDRAVRSLYATGYLHNHARMWLASYLVHLRKVHWRAGADWLYAHLLDGDLASNHLSWQWIAGTGSHRPYLFNAGNVLRYAPPDWQVLGTVLDQSYAAMEVIARDPNAVVLPVVDGTSARGRPGTAGRSGVVEPAPTSAPATWTERSTSGATKGWTNDPTRGVVDAAGLDVGGRDVWVVHPWCLADPPPGLHAVAIVAADFHARWPWSPRRWDFVVRRMRSLAPRVCFDRGDTIVAALARARSVHGRFDPHLAPGFATLGLAPEPSAFDGPARCCRSFSTWWAQTRLARREGA
jgi:deoxyribodipyrimidine photo-lyase